MPALNACDEALRLGAVDDRAAIVALVEGAWRVRGETMEPAAATSAARTARLRPVA